MKDFVERLVARKSRGAGDSVQVVTSEMQQKNERIG